MSLAFNWKYKSKHVYEAEVHESSYRLSLRIVDLPTMDHVFGFVMALLKALLG